MARAYLTRSVLRALLLFYPRDFRKRFGTEVLEVMEEIVNQSSAHGGRGPTVWIRIAFDAFTQGCMERLANHPIAFGRSASNHRGTVFMDVFFVDMRQALRSLLKRPSFTLVSALTLAMGIAATTTIFSLVNAVLLQPLPFPEAERLVGLWHAAPGLRPDEINQSPASYFLYRDNNRVFEAIGLWDTNRTTVTGLDEPERLQSLTVTADFLPMLRFPMAMGRAFSPEEDRPGAPGTVVLNHFYWQSRFGSDANVLGRSISLDGMPHEVIGVLAPGFLFSEQALLIPARFDRATVINGDFSYQIIARLGPGATLESAQADLVRLMPRLATEFTGNITPAVLREGQFRPIVRSLKEDFVGGFAAGLWVLLGTVGIVLLIACANVGNLYLVRAESRQRDVAIRTAMGASRGSILRYFLIESSILGLLGGAAGLFFAYWGVEGLLRFGPELLQQIPGLGIDLNVLGFTFLISIFSGLLFGLLPVAKYSRPDLVSALKEGGRGSGTGKEGHRVRNGLVIGQLALAVVLLVGSGLMFRSFQAITAVDPGFDRPEDLITVSLSLPTALIPDDETASLQHEEILQLLAQIPGVTSTGASTSVTMDGRDSHNAIHFEDFPLQGDQLAAIHRVKSIAGDYSETMGIPLVAGRTMTWTDLHDRARFVVVSEDLALRYWPTAGDALGHRLGFQAGDWYEIIGVTGAVHDDGMHKPEVPIVYFPMTRANATGVVTTRRTMTHVLRSSTGADIMPQVREAIWSVNGSLPLTGLGTHGDVVQRSLGETAFSMTMLALSAVMALILGVVGIYSVISYIVSQRSQEIGVRMALGADRTSVGKLVMRQGAVLAGTGVALGLVGALGFANILAAASFGVSRFDPFTFLSVALGLSAVALLATYIPARRAASVDPAIALRGR